MAECKDSGGKVIPVINRNKCKGKAHRNSHKVGHLNFPSASSSSAALFLPLRRFSVGVPLPSTSSSRKTTRSWPLQPDRPAHIWARQPSGDQRSFA